jgi:hypothetical protein
LETLGIVASQGAGPKRTRHVADRTALLDLWAEENDDRPTRTPAHLLAPSTGQPVTQLAIAFKRCGVQYALTGAAAGSIVAPFITTVPVIEVWVQSTASPEQICDVSGATPVPDGQNVVFLQVKGDAPLVFRESAEGLSIVNSVQLYSDLRRDPRRGREQAEQLRRAVIRF